MRRANVLEACNFCIQRYRWTSAAPAVQWRTVAQNTCAVGTKLITNNFVLPYNLPRSSILRILGLGYFCSYSYATKRSAHFIEVQSNHLKDAFFLVVAEKEQPSCDKHHYIVLFMLHILSRLCTSFVQNTSIIVVHTLSYLWQLIGTPFEPSSPYLIALVCSSKGHHCWPCWPKWYVYWLRRDVM